MFTPSLGCRIVFGVTAAIGLAVSTTGVYLVASTRPNTLIVGGLVGGYVVGGYLAVDSQAAKMECGDIIVPPAVDPATHPITYSYIKTPHY